ncbi:MAG: endolytic transglycosylase MltG, partial [Clostridiales bacterium]|nr:endolytic transglycosylase MltG [Clostridiales bacterium]
IVSGESMDEIASDLQEAGLIEYPLLFKLFAAFTGKAEDGKIVSGTYELNTDMDYSALLTSIGPQSPVRSVVTVTIPEGYTLEEIFDLLEENGVCSAEDLMEAAETEEFDYDFLDSVSVTGANRLEGYLFPDTYEFYMQASATSVINKLLSNFETRFDEEMQARLEELDRTMEEVMIVASIIEKETDGQDQKDIASVIYNRLSEDNTETNGYLQMDSTIQYLLDERKENLTAEDLAIDSPYNTYLYPGLPVGCICCPGLDAIEAALNPNETDYYYFYLGNDGTTCFFSDYTSFMQFREEQLAEAEADGEDEETASGDEDDAA